MHARVGQVPAKLRGSVRAGEHRLIGCAVLHRTRGAAAAARTVGRIAAASVPASFVRSRIEGSRTLASRRTSASGAATDGGGGGGARLRRRYRRGVAAVHGW